MNADLKHKKTNLYDPLLLLYRNSEGKPLIMIEKKQGQSSGLRVNKEVDPRLSAFIRVLTPFLMLPAGGERMSCVRG